MLLKNLDDVQSPKQDKQYMYNVTLRCILTTIVVWRSNKYYILWVCVCSLSYPACNQYAQYCYLWPATLYTVLPHHLKKAQFKKKNSGHKISVLISSTTFVCNISHSNKNWVRYDQKCIVVFKYPLCLSDYNETWIILTRFRKILKYQVLWRSVQWQPSYSMQRDGPMDNMTKLKVEFRNFVDALKKTVLDLSQLCSVFYQHLVMQGLVWLHMVRFRAIQLSTSYTNPRQLPIFKHWI